MEAARPAGDADVDAIVALEDRMRADLLAQRGGPLWLQRDARAEPFTAAVRGLLARDDARVVVGTIDDTVVGFATVEVDALHDGRRIGVVRELYVDPEARAVGVGEAIGEAVVAFCTAAGCAGIDAYALPGDRETKNFFERSGFTARALIMFRPL